MSYYYSGVASMEVSLGCFSSQVKWISWKITVCLSRIFLFSPKFYGRHFLFLSSLDLGKARAFVKFKGCVHSRTSPKGKVSAGNLEGLIHRLCSAQQQIHLKGVSALYNTMDGDSVNVLLLASLPKEPSKALLATALGFGKTRLFQMNYFRFKVSWN